MRYIISTARGAESIAGEELKEITEDFSSSDNFFFCDIGNPEKLKSLQSAYHVIKVVSEADSFDSLFDYPEADEEKNVKSFYCSSPREYKEELIGALSKKKYLKFSHPEIYYFLITLKHKFYLGIDMFGDLSKRDYRIFTTRFSLKGPVAYAIGANGIKMNNPPKKAAVIISTDGTEAIEFIKKFPDTETHGYCLENNMMKGAMKNIIVAGLKDKIKLFPDIDIQEKDFDRIIFPMTFNRTLKGVESLSILNEIISKNCLAKNGVISVLTLPEIAEKITKFSKKTEIWQGNNKLVLMTLD